jgi:hypothetical protein
MDGLCDKYQTVYRLFLPYDGGKIQAYAGLPHNDHYKKGQMMTILPIALCPHLQQEAL